MKVLFLDHDGVICLSNNFGTRFKKGILRYSQDMSGVPVLQRFDNFDKKAIKVLNDIIVESGCEIVVSSDWKRWATVEEMGEYYDIQGIIKKPIDFTTDINTIDIPADFPWSKEYELEQTRCFEIKEWLKLHPEVTHWVGIDDMFLGKSLTNQSSWSIDNFVWCPSVYEGIKQTGIKEKVLKFFK